MSTSTQVSKLKINKLTKEQYSSIVPSDTELYFILDEEDTYLPPQEGQEGKFLATNGTVASWETVDALPAQEGQEGKYLTTDGTDASWTDIPEILPEGAVWAELPDPFPSQTNQSGKYLATDGYNILWENANLSGNMSVLEPETTIVLDDNNLYKLTSGTDNITFTLPEVSDLSVAHQIMIQLYMSDVITLTLGTTYYFNKEAPDLSKAGDYDLVWEYDNIKGHWVFGAVLKGTA